MRRRSTERATARAAARLAAAACLLVGVTAVPDACVGPLRRTSPPQESPVDPTIAAWASTLDTARAALTDARPARADSVLSAFRVAHAGSAQAAEALYWRALARADVPEPVGGSRAAVADLDAYRTSPAPQHAAEAAVLRRALVLLDSARTAAATTVAAEKAVVSVKSGMVLVSRDTLRAHDEELQKTRADAAALQAELDRVRRRLAAPGRRP